MRRACMSILTILFSLAALLSTPVRAAELPHYYDMGTIHVQFAHDSCGTNTIVITYQIEYKDPAQIDTITAFKPKIQAVLFGALNDHFIQTGNTRLKSINRVMTKNVVETLGAEVATGVLIIDSQILST